MPSILSRLDYGARQALICTGVNSIFWFSWSFGSYQTIYLQEVGFTASQLGLLNALTSILSIASVSFWGMVSDRIGSLRKVLITVLAGGVGCSPHPPHPRGASLFHGPVLLPGAPGLFLPGLHVHLCGEPAGAQLQ